MLCLADRNFFGYELWKQARATGADLLWRVKKNLRLACEKRLSDGSYLSRIYPSERDWRHKTNGIVVRVIDYQLEGDLFHTASMSRRTVRCFQERNRAVLKPERDLVARD